jgi:hypothetical protein
MSFGATVRVTGKHPEIWLIQFAGSTTAGVGTAAVKQYATVYRVQGGQSVNTGTLPFSLSNNEVGTVVDLYLSVASVPATGDFQFDVEISNTSQKLFWDANTMPAANNSRPRLPAPGIYLPRVAQIAFAAYWITAQTAATATNLFATVMVSPVRA